MININTLANNLSVGVIVAKFKIMNKISEDIHALERRGVK